MNRNPPILVSPPLATSASPPSCSYQRRCSVVMECPRFGGQLDLPHPLGLPRWERRPPSDRALADAWLVERIAAIHRENRE
jgi:hypothetical protein